MTDPQLTRLETHAATRAVVLVLHGGQQNNASPVDSRNLSYLRMLPIQRSLFRTGKENGTAVWLLRYRVRGWNAPSGKIPDPVRDTRWALGEVRRTHPGVPIVLVGHSMGGRTACTVAGEEGVTAVCALAPWLPTGEPVEPVIAKPLIVIHGTADRWTSPRLSREYVQKVQAEGSPADWRPIRGAGHFMLRRAGTWHRMTRAAVTELLPPSS